MRRIPVRDIHLSLGETVTLPAESGHYVRDVLRLDVGTVVEVFATKGVAFEARIESLEPLVVTLVKELDAHANESPASITLYQAIPKKDRFEWVLEKATELGVARIVPLETSRSVVKVPANKAAAKVDRWQKICDAAARQSGRGVSPVVAAPMSLMTATQATRHEAEFVLDPTATVALAATVLRARDVAIWIGPEGGFDNHELQRLANRATACRIGPRVLRSETAGIVALAVVQVLSGGLD